MQESVNKLYFVNKQVKLFETHEFCILDQKVAAILMLDRVFFQSKKICERARLRERSGIQFVNLIDVNIQNGIIGLYSIISFLMVFQYYLRLFTTSLLPPYV